MKALTLLLLLAVNGCASRIPSIVPFDDVLADPVAYDRLPVTIDGEMLVTSMGASLVSAKCPIHTIPVYLDPRVFEHRTSATRTLIRLVRNTPAHVGVPGGQNVLVITVAKTHVIANGRLEHINCVPEPKDDLIHLPPRELCSSEQFIVTRLYRLEEIPRLRSDDCPLLP